MKAFSIRTFKVNVTPPVGDYLCGGMNQPSLGVETPLFLRGLILSTNETRYAIAVVDFCYLAGRSHQRLQKALAEAACIPDAQVTLHSTHVHDAPLINEEAHELIPGEAGALHNETYFQCVLGDTQAAVVRAMTHAGVAINSIAFSQHEVKQFASSRRVLDDNNRSHTRWSRCKN